MVLLARCRCLLVLGGPPGVVAGSALLLDPDTKYELTLTDLKDKPGNRSNASAEVEYDAAFAWLVGEPGRGVRTIIEMVSATRLDCVLGSAAIMRQACVTAVHYAAGRRTFGAPLISHPLMTSVLADLGLQGANLALALTNTLLVALLFGALVLAVARWTHENRVGLLNLAAPSSGLQAGPDGAAGRWNASAGTAT